MCYCIGSFVPCTRFTYHAAQCSTLPCMCMTVVLFLRAAPERTSTPNPLHLSPSTRTPSSSSASRRQPLITLAFLLPPGPGRNRLWRSRQGAILWGTATDRPCQVMLPGRQFQVGSHIDDFEACAQQLSTSVNDKIALPRPPARRSRSRCCYALIQFIVSKLCPFKINCINWPPG